MCATPLSLCRWESKPSYGRGLGLDVTLKTVKFLQPYLPSFQMPGSKSITGRDPQRAAGTMSATVVDTSDPSNPVAYSFVGCYAITDVYSHLPNFGTGSSTPSCAAHAKKNGGTVFARLVG